MAAGLRSAAIAVPKIITDAPTPKNKPINRRIAILPSAFSLLSVQRCRSPDNEIFCRSIRTTGRYHEHVARWHYDLAYELNLRWGAMSVKNASKVGPRYPQVVVLVGATGDLSQRRLLPGLFH